VSEILQQKGLLVACDVTDLRELRQLVTNTHALDAIVGYKVGLSLSLNLGLAHVVAEVRALTDKPIIYDHQKAGTDIPAMGEKFARVCCKAGVDAAILFPMAGPDTQRGWIGSLRAEGVEPIVGGLMTHSRFLECDGGYVCDSAPEQILFLAKKEGVRLYVLPGTKTALARTLAASLGEGSRFLVPGIGTQGGSIGDLAEFLPIEYCLPIIGSAIYQAPDQSAAAEGFAEEYLRALGRV